ncbi:MAG: hypothetical protein AAF530_00810 [Pseudomonadota bacterium]
MTCDDESYPPSLPPGFSYIDDEPPFDPGRHLALEGPAQKWALADFGYDETEISQFASPIAATSSVRILSTEGLEAARAVIARLEGLTTVHDQNDYQGQRRLYYGTYRSRFLRDLAGCAEITTFLSDLFNVPIAGHTMGHLACQVNFGSQVPGAQIAGWHHDIVGFTLVLGLHDPAKIEGGHFVYFNGTRQEGATLLARDGTLPDNRLIVADAVPPGHATALQGTAILHSAQALRRPGWRCNIINSYVCRDVTAPDPNRAYPVDGFYPSEPLDPIPGEIARHAAWIARGKLKRILEDLAWTDDREKLAAHLEAAVEDVTRATAQIRQGNLTLEQYEAAYDFEDERQITAKPFRAINGDA